MKISSNVLKLIPKRFLNSVYEKKTKDELIGQDEKELNTLNIGSNETVVFNLKKGDEAAGKVKIGLNIVPPSGKNLHGNLN